MKKLTTGRWLITHLLVLVMLVILVSLGFWQLSRLEERRALNDKITAGLDQPAMTLTGSEPVNPETVDYRRVQVTGTFDNAEAILLRNRSFNGVPGHHLIAPLRLSGSDKAVLVDRGWLPIEETDPERRTAYDVEGEVTIEGVAYKTQTPPHRFAPANPPRRPDQPRLDAWFRVNIDRIQEQIPYPLLPVFVAQSPPSDQTVSALPRPEGAQILDEGPHLGYAIQWFSFALILAITYGAFIRQELKSKEKQEIQVPDMPHAS